ncbi:ribonuclease J [Candidatus Woesearchaeota archaeon]|mgnify:CR=1 FL=1|nr:MAG: ribonuclease J [Candidatus Woesearchaeota archaeon]
MIVIKTIGGYNEVGKNMTAIKCGNDVVIFDMGLHLENYIRVTEDEQGDIKNITVSRLLKAGAIPDVRKLGDWKSKVKAIIPTHAHLDHVGAIHFLARKFDAPIICTPFTKAVIKTILKDEKIRLDNEIKSINVNSMYKLTDEMCVEFINMTHSTPQTVMVALHTPEGVVVYANDFKFDSHPMLGKKPNYARLKKLAEEKVIALIVDCIYAKDAKKTPSEKVAESMLQDVLTGVESEGKAIIVTTFSSHLARLKSIIKFGKRLRRKIIFLGRSLAKYVNSAESINLINFKKDVELIKYSKKIKAKLDQVAKHKDRYLLVVTGHQGEPKAVLSKMIDRFYNFKFGKDDIVIFSCTVIPNKLNIKNRKSLEEKLRSKGVRIFRDIHVSGHAAKEDLRDLINMLRPANIIPAHGVMKMSLALAELAQEVGYSKQNIFVSRDGKQIVLSKT